MSLLAKLGSNIPEDCADFMFDNRDIYDEFKKLIDHEDSFEMIKYNTLKIDEVWKSCNDKRDFNNALKWKIDEIYNVDSFIIAYELSYKLYYHSDEEFQEIIPRDMKFDTFVPDNNGWQQIIGNYSTYIEKSASEILECDKKTQWVYETPSRILDLNPYNGINLDKYIEIARENQKFERPDLRVGIGYIVWSLNYLPKYIYKYLSTHKPKERSYKYFYHEQFYIKKGYRFKKAWASFEGDRPPTLGKLKEMLQIEHIGRFEPNGKCAKVAR